MACWDSAVGVLGQVQNGGDLGWGGGGRGGEKEGEDEDVGVLTLEISLTIQDLCN